MKVSFFPSVGLHPWQRYSRIFWNYQVSDYVKINTEEKAQLERRGALAGLDTCWFNPRLKLNNTEIDPTYQIQKQDDLKRIVTLKDKLGVY